MAAPAGASAGIGAPLPPPNGFTEPRGGQGCFGAATSPDPLTALSDSLMTLEGRRRADDRRPGFSSPLDLPSPREDAGEAYWSITIH